MKKKDVVIIHTSFVSIDHLKSLFSSIIPEAQIHNIVDDSLLSEVMENNGVTDGIVQRLRNYIGSAQNLGADAILSQCSSMGPAIDLISESCKVPILKVDQAMAEKAVSIGDRIAVVATVASTLKPSCQLIKTCAEKIGKKIEIAEHLVDGALNILLEEGDKEKHNNMVLDKIRSLDGKYDVIVLAQGSMAVLDPFLKDIKTPTLTSPELGVRRMREVLELI